MDAAPEVLRTHDAAADVLRGAAPGARVTIAPVARGTDACRRYEVRVDRIGREPLAAADTYALPCLAAPLRARVRDLLEAALKETT